jgi:transposase
VKVQFEVSLNGNRLYVSGFGERGHVGVHLNARVGEGSEATFKSTSYDTSDAAETLWRDWLTWIELDQANEKRRCGYSRFAGVDSSMMRGHSDWMARPDAPHRRELTDEQWNFIGPFLPELACREDGRGRPWRENRAVLNGILWILRTGAPWADLPDRYPSYQTCHRRFQDWVRCGVLKDILSVLAEALHDEGYLDLRDAFIDGSFAPVKKAGLAWERRSAARDRRSWRSPIVMGGRRYSH